MRNCLIICRNISGLNTLTAIASKRSVIVATDDPQIQAWARTISGVQSVCFIEKAEPFYNVAQEVLDMLAQIDADLQALDPTVSPEILSWGRNVEGGFTTQRVQDTLLLIRSYTGLFAETACSEVHIIRFAGALWDDEVLAACAKVASIPIFYHMPRPWAVWQARIARWARPWAVGAYYVFNVLRLGGGRGFRPPASEMRTKIAFQLCSSRRGHVENISELMDALVTAAQRPIGVCWGASDRISAVPGAKQLADRGLSALSLEQWVTWKDLISSALVAIRLAHRGSQRNLWAGLQYRGILLAPLLWESRRQFWITMLPQRIRYARAFAAALRDNPPLAIKLWAGPESFEGKTAVRFLRPTGITVFFHYWLGASLEWPYGDGRGSLDLFLAKGAHEAELASREYQLDYSQIEVVGQVRFSAHIGFASETSVEASRKELKLPTAGRRYIGVDTAGVIRGYFSSREQAEMIQSVLAVARRVPTALIVFKPHPGYQIAHLQPLIDEAALPNVFVLSRSASAMHFLNAIDIFVTKFSTLILEAALFRRGTVAAIFDGEERFKEFGDIADVADSPKVLEHLLTTLSENDDAFIIWKQARQQKAEKLLPQYYHQSERPVGLAASEAICRRIGMRASTNREPQD